MKLALLICLLWAALSLPAGAREFFVSPGGDDAAPGTRTAPWQSLGQASAGAAAGDTVIFLVGSYPGCLEPASSGEPGRPITFRADKPLGARLTGGAKSSDGRTTCLRLRDCRYVVVEGFEILPDQPQMWLQMTGCTSCTVRRCRMQLGGMSYVPAAVQDCRYCRFEGLDLSRAVQLDANGHVGGNMFQLNNSSHNVITDCRFGRAGHDPFCLWFDCTYNVVRRCVFNSVWGRNFEFFTAPHTLVEGCTITNGYHGSGSADGRAKLFIREGIFRRNLIYRNWYQPLTIHAYKYEQLDPFGMTDSRLYHNTFYRNYESGFEMFDLGANPEPHMVRGNVLQNNIFCDNDPGGDGVQLMLDGGIGRDNVFRGNLFYGGAADRGVIRYSGGWPAGSTSAASSATGCALGANTQLRTAAEAEAQLPAQFSRNLEADPRFADAEADNYRPGRGSPAIDAALPLTSARGSGRGRTLPVEDARPFYDGFGIPGEAGDLLFIGARKQQARVVQVEAEARLLHLDRDVTWQAGDAVTLPHVGRAADLGAFEVGGEKLPGYCVPTTSPALRITTLADASGPFAATGFEPEDRERWFYWWYTHRQPNTEARIDDSTAAGGTHSLCIRATGDKSTLSCLLRPPGWDVDRYPFVRFSYRIPPGVPVGIRLDAFAAESRGYGAVYVGGSPARATSDRDLKEIALLDDDHWHEATVDVRTVRRVFPEVGLLRTFWFYTNANAKQGQQFWFDDFRIERGS